MRNRSKDVDAYIAKAAPFARPILETVRDHFHKACPEIEETTKWGFPHFQYKGIVGSMAAFKKHASFGFWKGQLMDDPHGIFKGVGNTSMSGMKVESVSELPSERVMLKYIRQAVALNEEGVKVPRVRAAKPAAAVKPPDDFMAKLKKNKKALATFEAFPPSHRKEYVEWVTEARQEATRAKRLETAIEWISEGKPRNWKYMKGRA